MSRLAEIYKREIKTGGNLGSAMTKTLGEKMDPRQVFDRSGIATALFPSQADKRVASVNSTARTCVNSDLFFTFNMCPASSKRRIV
jgi:hypothetical protein